MREIYTVQRPNRIVLGDPMYFERFTGAELKRLTVDFRPPANFSARVMLAETPLDEFPGEMGRSMCIFLAPEQTMDTYLDGMKYKTQENTVRKIGVDTARYFFRVDENADTIYTGGDGYWGEYEELFRKIDGKKILDAVIIYVALPEFETTESMRQRTEYFFKDMKLIESQAEQEEDSQAENSFHQSM